MTPLRTAAQQAIALICSARLCEVNSMSSRQEMLRLLIEATDTLRAALTEDALQRFTDVNQEIEAALAEPVQEPYAWMAVGGTVWRHKSSQDDVPLYTTSPQRKPLTEEEIYGMYSEPSSDAEMVEFARAVERTHGIT